VTLPPFLTTAAVLQNADVCNQLRIRNYELKQ
jgi:hypothetical protein